MTAQLNTVDLSRVTALHLGAEPVAIVPGSLALHHSLSLAAATGGSQRLPGTGPFYVALTPDGSRILGELSAVRAWHEAPTTDPDHTDTDHPGGTDEH